MLRFLISCPSCINIIGLNSHMYQELRPLQRTDAGSRLGTSTPHTSLSSPCSSELSPCRVQGQPCCFCMSIIACRVTCSALMQRIYVFLDLQIVCLPFLEILPKLFLSLPAFSSPLSMRLTFISFKRTHVVQQPLVRFWLPRTEIIIQNSVSVAVLFGQCLKRISG